MDTKIEVNKISSKKGDKKNPKIIRFVKDTKGSDTFSMQITKRNGSSKTTIPIS